MNTTIMKRTVAMLTAAAALAGLAVTTTTAMADTPYDITVRTGLDDANEQDNSLKGRKLTAYKLADYVDGTYVSIGDDNLDGVAVDTPGDANTPGTLKYELDRVLAKTTGVSKVTDLPGWTYAQDPKNPNWATPGATQNNADQSHANAGGDPIAWLGGFRQTPAGQGKPGDQQNVGSFGYGNNTSGPNGIGNNSPVKAYTGSVREFADNLIKDDAAMAVVKQQPHSAETNCADAATCTIQLTAQQGSGVYLIVDAGGKDVWTGTDDNGFSNTWSVGVSQPMIVPTKPDQKDVSTLYGKNNEDSLGSTGKLGEIVIKNVTDHEVLPHEIPKQRDETVKTGQDAADNGSDVWDNIPYVVSYRIPDMSAFKAAYDNGDPWIYNYRIIDNTDPGLKIDGLPTVSLYPADAKLYDANGKVQSPDKIVDSKGQHVNPVSTIDLKQVDQVPAFAAAKTGTKDGQPNEPDAWVNLNYGKDDASNLTIGLGKWIVKNYGNVKLNDRAQTKYEYQLYVRYTATVTDRILLHNNMTKNDNHLDYTHNPNDVNSGEHHETPHVKIRQWTYDIDLYKRASTSNIGLENVEFTLTVKDNKNQSDAKPNGTILKFVPASDVKGDYRLANADESKDGGKGSTTLVTGKDGLLRIRGLDLGVYTLRETKAADRYQLLESTEDVNISATFVDDKSDFITPNAQTTASEEITQNNQIWPLKRPMLNFSKANAKDLPAGLTVTATKALWSGQADDKHYYADNQTHWSDADLTLWNQPINTMLAKTGGVLSVGLITLMGVGLIVGGVMVRRRKDMPVMPPTVGA